jgi:hypothetical protein
LIVVGVEYAQAGSDGRYVPDERGRYWPPPQPYVHIPGKLKIRALKASD